MLSVSDLLQHVRSTSAIGLISGTVLLIAFATFSRIFYNIFLHPLAKFPGPWYLTCSDVVYAYLQLRGTSQFTQKKLHDKYGNVVRIGPSTLSFIDVKAWDEIYGYRKGVAALPKDPMFYNEMILSKDTIAMAKDIDAVPVRRAMNTAFSSKNLLDQAPMLREHMQRLMGQLEVSSKQNGSKGVDLREWYTMSMFDINSDFSFGEDMGCVSAGKFHEWVQFVVDYFYAATLIHQCHKFWPLAPLLAKLLPASLRETQRRHNEASLQRVRRRMAQDLDRPDFMYHFQKAAVKENLSPNVIEAQATVVILAGSETTAVGLTAATYELLKHPKVYQQLCNDVRQLFENEEAISLRDTLNKLPYLDAVVWESLRMLPPLANGFSRVVPDWQRDFTIVGQSIPPSTVVTISHFCANRSGHNFQKPEEFLPERWLGGEEYRNDVREVVQPFSVGPRNCPGRNFALNNIKLAMVHMIMNFDMDLAAGMENWGENQKVYNGWRQPALQVILRKR